jgi:CHAD domain-containing protein
VTLPADLLGRIPEEAVRLITLDYVDAMTAARLRLDDPSDTEALHDFRVALRRLRTALRAYRRYLKGSTPDALRRRLHDLARATNAGRDAEVQLAWAEAQRDKLGARQRGGYRWLVKRSTKRRRRAYEALRREVDAAFDKLERRLHQRLTVYRSEVRREGDEPAPTFGEAVASLLRSHARDLSARLARIGASGDDDRAAHQARIAGKHLRYLMEPLVAQVASAEHLVGRLKSLQDLLGELHDVVLLDERIATAIRRSDRGHKGARPREQDRPGLVALAREARSRHAELFATLRGAWLDGRGGDFFRQLDQTVERLATPTRPRVDAQA